MLLFAKGCCRFMTSSSVSFRITRHTEDLAQTIHALSQRLVQLEQRFATLEAQLLKAQEQAPTSDHLASLANVDQLFRDCRELLAEGGPTEMATAAEPATTAAASRPCQVDPSAEADHLDGLDEAA